MTCQRELCPTRLGLTIIFSFAFVHFTLASEQSPKFKEVRAFPAPEAHQGVAVDADHLYVITNRSIAKYNKQSEQLVKRWDSPEGSHLRHLNGGTVVDGKLYCGHSNWPKKPSQNTIEVWDTNTLEHVKTIPFGHTDKAFNWVDRHDGFWWVVYATYGDAESVRKTVLIKYDDQWQELQQWTFPDEVVKQFLPYSNSGGSWGPDGLLYATGHDREELYVLKAPKSGNVLQLKVTLPVTVQGQGIAWDRTNKNRLYGIRRKTREVVELKILP